MKFLDLYNGGIGAMVTLLIAVFGDYWYIFAAFIIFNIFDWMTGWYKSRRLKAESSVVGL